MSNQSFVDGRKGTYQDFGEEGFEEFLAATEERLEAVQSRLDYWKERDVRRGLSPSSS